MQKKTQRSRKPKIPKLFYPEVPPSSDADYQFLAAFYLKLLINQLTQSWSSEVHNAAEGAHLFIRRNLQHPAVRMAVEEILNKLDEISERVAPWNRDD
jgi:hypothetical protein